MSTSLYLLVWNDQEKIARCNETLILTLHLILIILWYSIAVITILAGFGVYKGFFANKELKDPWDDHDD